jgi:predicted CXXCH cytochrome family protein
MAGPRAWASRAVRLALAVALAAGCRPIADPGPAWVGSAACAACHPTAYRLWRESMHAHAAAEAAPRPPFDGRRRTMASGDFRPLADAGHARVEVFAEGGATETTPVAYTLGDRYVQQFLVPAAGGRWQVLPAGYDPQAGEWFDVFPEAPGPQAWTHWRNPGATANAQCLECHVTGYRKGYDLARDAYASTWQELGVGCEACHGPGGAHVRGATGGGAVAIERGRSMDACVLCHSRRAVLAEGYVPGRSPWDHFDPELLDTDVYHASGQVRGEAYEWTSFQMSRMAAAGVRCADCHEPHAAALRADGNALCLRCHEARLAAIGHTHHAPGGAGSACVGCHMPPAVFMERDVRRDHFVAPPDPELAAAIGAPDACTTCHRDRDQAWAAEAVATWYGRSVARGAAAAVTTLIEGLRRHDPDAVQPALDALQRGGLDDVRAASILRLLVDAEARDAVVPVASRYLGAPSPLVRAAAVRALGSSAAPSVVADAAIGAPLLVRAEAGFALRAARPTAASDPRLAALRRAWWTAQQGLQDVPEVHYNAALFLTAEGDLAGAEREYLTGLRLWPWDPAPRQNLALLLAGAGRPADAETELRDLVRRFPAWAPGHFALGLLYGETDRAAEAVDALARCLAADPGYPRAAYNLGLAQAALGAYEAAVASLERAVDDPAAHADALRQLVRLAQQHGDVARRDRWLPAAILADPAVRDDPEVLTALGLGG